MSQHVETNPHFIRQPPRQDQQGRSRPHGLGAPPHSQDADHRPPRPHVQWVPDPEHPDQAPQQHGLRPPVVPHSQNQDQHFQPYGQGQSPRPHDLEPQPPKRKGRHSKPQGAAAAPVLQPQHHGRHSQPHGAAPDPVEQPQRQGRHSPYGVAAPVEQPHRQGRHSHPRDTPQHLRVPTIRKTKPLTWFAAIFCMIFWIIIILGGLIVLIVYLVFRPRSPRFDISSVTLNAAYLDMGYLLNADLTVLANFTNPNKKVSVDFSYMILELHYGNTLIATQYIEPFSAARAASKFETVHMVSSQVRLPIAESVRLQKQMAANGAIFEVKGLFRARSRLGSVLRYSYWLYGNCKIVLTAPPSGVLRSSKCRTKR